MDGHKAYRLGILAGHIIYIHQYVGLNHRQPAAVASNGQRDMRCPGQK